MRGRMVVVGAALSLLAGEGFAQQVLQKEPRRGALPPSAKVLVDDRSCPKGQIKEITGGSATGGSHRLVRGGQISKRQRKCIPYR